MMKLLKCKPAKAHTSLELQ